MKALTKMKLEEIVFRIRLFNSEVMQELADDLEKVIESEDVNE